MMYTEKPFAGMIPGIRDLRSLWILSRPASAGRLSVSWLPHWCREWI